MHSLVLKSSRVVLYSLNLISPDASTRRVSYSFYDSLNLSDMLPSGVLIPMYTQIVMCHMDYVRVNVLAWMHCLPVWNYLMSDAKCVHTLLALLRYTCALHCGTVYAIIIILVLKFIIVLSEVSVHHYPFTGRPSV